MNQQTDKQIDMNSFEPAPNAGSKNKQKKIEDPRKCSKYGQYQNPMKTSS